MNNRKRTLAILNYDNYDRMPVVHFGFLTATLEKWCQEGHLKEDDIIGAYDGSEKEKAIAQKLGFDFNWFKTYQDKSGFGSLFPAFETKDLEVLEDGKKKVLTAEGAIVMVKPGTHSIPCELDHMLKDRKSWEEYYLPKLQYTEERIDFCKLDELLDDSKRDEPLGLYCKSLYGQIRDWLGIVGISYLAADDEELYDEIINTVANLCYRVTERVLATGAKFDFAHYWEDICYKNGSLVNPNVFKEKVGPQYKKMTQLLNKHGIKIISLDCDGFIDSLLPIWLENGVNTMFPIEVGTWDANIKPWREKYGKELRGVGGMDKRIFAYDYTAIDKEIERLKPLVELGGYIPCPDHRLPHDCKWQNVQYYCERMRKTFGG